MYSLTLVYSLIHNSYFAKISIILKAFYAFVQTNSLIISIILMDKSTSNRIIFEKFWRF